MKCFAVPRSVMMQKIAAQCRGLKKIFLCSVQCRAECAKIKCSTVQRKILTPLLISNVNRTTAPALQ